jgi:hypothetical protein
MYFLLLKKKIFNIEDFRLMVKNIEEKVEGPSQSEEPREKQLEEQGSPSVQEDSISQEMKVSEKDLSGLNSNYHDESSLEHIYSKETSFVNEVIST